MRTIEKRQEMKPIEMKLARRLGGVGEYYFSKKLREIDRMRASGRQIINLGIGSPDRPPHPDVIGTLAAEAAKPGNHGYQPYKGAAVLREAFALWYKERYGVALDPEGEILPLIGSKEGVMHVCMTYLDEGDRVLVPNPGYPTYRSAVTIAGGVCVDYVLREDGGWMPDFDEIERGGLQGVKMMIVNYPHMPTGAAPKEGLFRRLVDFARRHGILLLHDNPYSFLRNDRPESLLATPGATEVALELNSLSKSHCMAGWRIGMIGGARERIDEIIDPELTLDRALETYLKKGYDLNWVNQRLQTIQVRKGLTDEWERRGVEKGKEYAILADEITRAWSGMTTRQYKDLKDLKKENLRDNMTTLELVLNTLAEVTTTEFSKASQPEGFEESRQVAREGGSVAGAARAQIEARTGKPATTSENARDFANLIEDVLETDYELTEGTGEPEGD